MKIEYNGQIENALFLGKVVALIYLEIDPQPKHLLVEDIDGTLECQLGGVVLKCNESQLAWHAICPSCGEEYEAKSYDEACLMRGIFESDHHCHDIACKTDKKKTDEMDEALLRHRWQDHL